MSEYYIEMKKMTVGYHGRPLIRDISIGIEKGEIITLIGPNGAGKSTILKSITRQLSLISGTVMLTGNALQDLSYKNLSQKMAVVLTERIHPELMTCWDVVATGRYPYTGRLGILSNEDKEKVEAALNAVHAQELGEQDFNSISDGQRQRILLARAICQEPEIMVLDEPTSFLDIRNKLELLSILRTMAREQQITVILSLHEIDLAQKISDRLLCVKGEYLSHYGTPEEIFREEIIRELYEVDNGFYDPLFGSMELPPPVGEPRVFVLSSGGRGIPVYRRLQKAGIPFTAGILYKNDIDYQLARLLAREVVTEEPFRELGQEVIAYALSLAGKCGRILNAGIDVGPCNRRIEEFLLGAGKQGIPVGKPEDFL